MTNLIKSNLIPEHLHSVDHWINLFNELNNNPEIFVPFVDTEYYTEQLHNLTDEVDWDWAESMAEEIAKNRSNPK